MKKGEFVFEHFAGTVFRKTRHRIKALLKLGELECGFRDKFFKVVKKKKGRKERWTLSLKFENGLFRIKNKLTVCSLPSFLPRTNGINFFNSERGVNLTPPSDLPVKSGKLTRASRSSISFLPSSFYAADVSNEGREGPNEAIHFSSYSSSSNAASPLFREMEITRIKCLHPPQCRSTVPSSRSPPNLLQSFHGDTRLRSSGV